MQEKNIGFEFLNQAMKNPDLLALVTEDTLINYESLARIVIQFGKRMRDLDVHQGSIVTIKSEDPVTVLASLIATALLGGQWIAFKNFVALKEFINPTHFFVFRAPHDNDPFSFVEIDTVWFQSSDADTDARAEPFEGYASPDDTFLIANTSGTTGTPKLVPLSQKMIFDRSKAAAPDFIERKTVAICLFPCVALPYITRALAAFLNSATLVEGMDPRVWRRAGVNFVVGSPVQAIDLLRGTPTGLKFAKMHVVGSRLTDPLAAELLTRFDKVFDVYASSETNRSFENEKRLDANGNIYTCGTKIDSDVEIIDEHGTLCPPTKVGIVRVRNPYLAKTYLNNPEAAALSFRDGCFYPGDLGHWGTKGELVIVGRTDDRINLGGVKVNAAEIDQVLKSVDGVLDAMVFANETEQGEAELLAFVVFKEQMQQKNVIVAMKAACERQLDAIKTPRRIVPVRAVPRAHDGGAMRWKCQNLYNETRTGTALETTDVE